MKRQHYKKIAFLYFAIFHLTLISVVVTAETFTAVRFYLSKIGVADAHNKSKFKSMQSALRSIVKLPGIYHYSIFSGTGVSYNFFAPKVARSIVLECIQLDKHDNEIGRMYFPYHLTTHEGIQRYSVSLSNFHNSLRDLDSTEKDKIITLLIRSVGKKFILSNNQIKAEHAKVSLCTYVYPTMFDFNKGIQPTLINVKTVKF
jgi:hypothetical protein